MNKRGVAVLVILFGAMLALIVAIVFFRIAYLYGSNEAFIRHNVAENSALMVNVLEGAPGDVEVVMPQNISEYVIMIEGRKTIVSDSKLEASGQAVRDSGRFDYLFVPRIRAPYTARKEDITYVQFEKKGEDIGFYEEII